MPSSVISHLANIPKGFGKNVLTVGDGGDFSTVAEAVAYINTTDRYTVVYDTGTISLTNGSQSATPSGGADFTALSTAESAKELWLYLDSALVWIPLIGMAPHLTGTTWGDYGELKYKYWGSTGEKSYQLVTPNWMHILLLPGEVADTTKIDWPLFTTISGVSRDACMFRGAIHVDASAPGIWMRNFSWGSIHGVAHNTEESLITVDDLVQSSEPGYCEIVMHSISGGRGNADRDVTYRTTSMVSHGLFESVGCDYYAYYDVTQCTARNLIFKDNNVYIHTQDTTVMFPTGFRWFSGATAPETDLFIDMSDNNFFVVAADGARAATGLILLDDSVGYLTAPPDVFGRVVNNHIYVRQLGTGDARGIQSVPSLFSTNDGRLLIDGNTFDVVSVGGTDTDILTHATASPLVLGRSNVTADGAEITVAGAPFRLENKGTSAAIATGGTIAHGLRATPTEISITPADTGVTDFYATADDTNITVNYSGGGTHTFHWKVSV